MGWYVPHILVHYLVGLPALMWDLRPPSWGSYLAPVYFWGFKEYFMCTDKAKTLLDPSALSMDGVTYKSSPLEVTRGQELW